MKKLMIMIIMGLLVSNVAWGETLTLSTGEYPPGYSEYSVGYGYVNHIVSEAYVQVGITVKYEFLPWKRAYSQVKKGNFAGSCCWFLNKQDRIDNFYHSEPIHTRGFWFFHLKSYNFGWNVLKDLQNIRIGGLSGAAYTDEFENERKTGKIEIVQLDTVEQSLKMLLKGRIDICLLDKSTGYVVIRKLGESMADKFTHHDKALVETSTHVLFSKSDSQKGATYRDLFNQGLEKLKQSGKYDQMLTDLVDGKYEVQKEKWK